MSWLDFANHFLSNQRLHAWSWINRTFSWEWFVSLWEFLALSVLGLFLFCFCLVWGEQATDAQDFGWQSKGEDHFRSWFPFFYLVTILYFSGIKGMSYIISMIHMQQWWLGIFMQNWSCMHPCGHSSIKFLWSCDTRAQDSFSLF